MAGSILFLFLQAFILVDFAYTLHEWLIARMDAADERMHGMDWEPGLLSNGWKVAYVVLSFGLLVATIAGIGGMFGVFSACPLNQARAGPPRERRWIDVVVMHDPPIPPVRCAVLPL